MNRLWILFLISSFAFSQDKKEVITVHFDSNSAEISKNDSRQLELLFSNLNTSATVDIIGFCDDVGTVESNLILSKKRAQSVADYLKNNFNLPASSIAGKGEVQLIATSQDEIDKQRAAHRSVTITVGYTDKNIVTKPAEEGYKTFADQLVVGDKIIIENILFVANRKVFDDDEKATAELQKITDYLQKNPTIHFAINGHVCCISKSFNDAHDRDSRLNNLSQTRAKRVYDYFVDHGIAKERMSHKGYGRQFPRPNKPEKENKRVEIVITKI